MLAFRSLTVLPLRSEAPAASNEGGCGYRLRCLYTQNWPLRYAGLSSSSELVSAADT